MNRKTNLLVLMCDQLQREPTDSDSLCETPHIERLRSGGVSFKRAYTPNPVCSPARASFMTGRLPHNHGVLWVTHTMDKDQGVLREDREHWAMALKKQGYSTGYFGKWHITHEENPLPYGWDVDGSLHGPNFETKEGKARDHLLTARYLKQPGYKDALVYGTTSLDISERPMGVAADLALDFLREQSSDKPWCCMVSLPEPHDPFICGTEAYDRYKDMDIPVKENWSDSMEDKPAIYRRSAEVNRELTVDDWKEAVRHYYGSITEIDSQFGRVLDYLDETDQADNTLIFLTADHGDFLGSHGLYCKNLGSFEEAYNVPLIAAGPGIARGIVTSARVGTQDVYPTLFEYFGLEGEDISDCRSFLSVLRDPAGNEKNFTDGFSEYAGGRILLNQRVYYRDQWKYVFNTFDYDELYNLEEDPEEIINLADQPEHREKLEEMLGGAWEWMKKTGDHTLVNSQYPPFRFFAAGPEGS